MITRLDWDSDFFGIEVGKAKINNENELPSLNTYLNNNSLKYHLIYLFSNEPLTNSELDGFKLDHVDTKVTYCKNVQGQKTISADITIYDGLLNKELFELAISSGIYSRFNIDPNIPKKKFTELYSLWLEKSLSKDLADEVFVSMIENKYAGFATVKINCKTANVGLIAVNPQFRGNKIGSNLLGAVNNFALEHHLGKILIPTQKQNIPACKFYKYNGYTILSEDHIYHMWNKKT